MCVQVLGSWRTLQIQREKKIKCATKSNKVWIYGHFVEWPNKKLHLNKNTHIFWFWCAFCVRFVCESRCKCSRAITTCVLYDITLDITSLSERSWGTEKMAIKTCSQPNFSILFPVVYDNIGKTWSNKVQEIWRSEGKMEKKKKTIVNSAKITNVCNMNENIEKIQSSKTIRNFGHSIDLRCKDMKVVKFYDNENCNTIWLGITSFLFARARAHRIYIFNNNNNIWLFILLWKRFAIRKTFIC